MAATYKLSYFNATALAEVTRWLFTYANIEFEDHRLERAEWTQDHKTNMPFEKIPVLTYNGKQYVQSIAIARYAAKQAKLVGDNDLEDLEIDGMVNTINDLRAHTREYGYEEDKSRKEKLKGPYFNETLPFFLDRLDKIAKENDGYLACNKLTWADFYFTALLDYLKFLAGQDLIEKYDNLQKVRDNVVNIPQIKKWIDQRPRGWF